VGWYQKLLVVSPWVAAIIIGVRATARIIIVLVALRGSAPNERAAIIRAIGEMLRFAGRREK
jgi:hypothetical protein